MVAAFLRAEITSSRFGGAVTDALEREGLDRRVIDHPDVTDLAACAARRRVLARYRGYPDRGVFTGLPRDTRWQWTGLTIDELLRVRYLNWDYWLEVSGGTRLPADAISRIGHGPIYRDLVAAIAAGTMPPEIIVVGRAGGRDLVVLEGHVRLTALVMAAALLPAQIRVLLGTSHHMDK